MARRVIHITTLAGALWAAAQCTPQAPGADTGSDLAIAVPRVSTATYYGGAYSTNYPPAYSTYYAPAYSSYYAPSYSTYYAPWYSTYYAPGYSTYSGGYSGFGLFNPCCRPACNPCNPCATSCDPCGGGACQVSQGAASSSSGGPRTFKKPNEPGTNNDVKPPVPEKDDSKFENREKAKTGGFNPTREEKKKAGPGPAASAANAGAPQQRKAFKFPAGETKRPESVIHDKKPAPARPPVEKVPKSKSKKPVDEKSGPRLEALQLDETITSRPAVHRTRLILRAAPGIRRDTDVVRRTVLPQAGPLPSREAARIVRN